MVIKQMVDVAVEEGTGVIIMGLSGQVARIMTELDALGGIPEEWFVGRFGGGEGGGGADFGGVG